VGVKPLFRTQRRLVRLIKHALARPINYYPTPAQRINYYTLAEDGSCATHEFAGP